MGVLHQSPFPREATTPLQERMRTNLFGRPGPQGEQFGTETCSLPAPDCLPSSFPESEGVPFDAERVEPGSTPSPQLLTHPGGCGGLKGSASSGAGGGWVPQMMGGPSPPCPPQTPHLRPLLWEQRRPQGADRGADSQAQGRASDPVSSSDLLGKALPPSLGAPWRVSLPKRGTRRGEGGQPPASPPSRLGSIPSLSIWVLTKGSLCPVYPQPGRPATAQV